MRGHLRDHLTYANVVSTACLFLLLGGSAYAAIQLSRGSVKTRHLARSAVTSAKVRDGALLRKDFRRDQLPAGEQGPPGAQGAQGPPGVAGATGPRGPSDAFSDETDAFTTIGIPGTAVAQVSLPAGSYVLTARMKADNEAMALGEGDCRLFAGATQIDEAHFDVEGSGTDDEESVTLLAARTFGGSTIVQAVCQDVMTDIRIGERRLTAIRVGTLTPQ